MTPLSSTVPPMALLWLGLFLGVRHAADSDHVVSMPVATAAQRWPLGDQLIRLGTGALSVALAVWLAYDIALNDGLFLATATWTPR